MYGPRDEDIFEKAIALRLTSTPSALGKKLVHLICPGAKPFTNCHCAKIVYGFWRSQMTPQIKSHLARQQFTAETYADIFKTADEVWRANGGTAKPPLAVVAAVTDSSEPSSSPQVSAVRGSGRGAGRGQRPFRGRGRGSGRGGQNSTGRGAYNNNSNQSQNASDSSSSSSNPKPHQKGPRASPDVPDNACSRHWKDGKAATYCSDPLNCSWVNFIAPRKS